MTNSYNKNIHNVNLEYIKQLYSPEKFIDMVPVKPEQIHTVYKSRNEIQNIIDEFKPNLILTERVSHFSSLITKMNIPLIIFLRGNYWHEIELGKQTLDKSKIPSKILKDLN